MKTYLAVERLEDRCTPAMVYGWSNGTYAWHDDPTVPQPPDIQPVSVQPTLKVSLAAPTKNDDGSISFKEVITSTNPNAVGVGLNLNWNAAASLVQVANVQQQGLIGVQAGMPGNGGTNANTVNAAWATPNGSWQADADAQMTLTFKVAPGTTVNPFAANFSSLPAGWQGVVDTSALDAFFAQQYP